MTCTLDTEFASKEKVELVVARLHACTHSQVDYDLLRALEASDASASAWLASDGKPAMDAFKSVFTCTAALIAILLNAKVAGNSFVNGDSIDVGLKTAARFVSSNFTAKTSEAPSVPGSDSKKKMKGGKGPVSTQLLQELMRPFSPLIVQLVDLVASLLCTVKQSEGLCFASHELAFAIISIDAAVISGREAASLLAMQRAAMGLLRTLSSKYPQYRQPLVLETLTLLAAAYSAKTPVKSISLWSYSPGRICASLACLLSVLQSRDTSPDLSAQSVSGVAAALADTKHLCNGFCSELLKRCGHKDMSGVYRLATLRVMDDLYLTLPCPEYPVASILFETLLRYFIGQLNSILNNPSAKRDISYVNFLLDVLALCGSYTRTFINASKKEADTTAAYTFTPVFLERFEKKLVALRSDWLESGVVHDSSSSKDKSISSIESALTIHLSTTSAALECTVEQSKYFDASVDMVVPSAPLLLSATPCCRDIAKILPALHETDVLNHLLTEFLRLHLDSNSVNVEDAYVLTLQCWILESNDRGKTDMSAHLLDVLSKFFQRKTAPGRPSGAEVVESSINQEEKLRSCFSAEWIRKSMRNLLTLRNLSHIFDSILTTVLVVFVESSPLIRARAMKALSTLLRNDPDLILKPQVKETISERLFDAAICVREEAVKLIGVFVFLGVDLNEEFLESLLSRLEDSGVSVRKAVVNILKSFLMSSPNHRRYGDICLRLLHASSLPKEEDSVRELITQSFQQLWFLPPPDMNVVSGGKQSQPLKSRQLSIQSNPTDNIENDDELKGLLQLGWKVVDICKAIDYPDDDEGSSLRRVKAPSEPDMTKNTLMYMSPGGFTCTTIEDAVAYSLEGRIPKLEEESKVDQSLDSEAAFVAFRAEQATAALSDDPGDSSTAQFDDNVKSTALQIVSVANQLDDNSWIIAVIRETLYSKGLGAGTPAVVAKRRLLSLAHCGKIVQCLMNMLIRCEDELSAAAATSEEVKQPIRMNLLSILLSIAIFCKAHPQFFLPYVLQILPYLKGENNVGYPNECRIALSIAEMITAASVIQGFSLGSKLDELNGDLVQIAFRFSNPNIDAAIACMAAIAVNVSHDVSPLMKLGEKCFRSFQLVAIAYSKSKTLAKDHAARLQRCIIVLGFVCEHSRKCSGLFPASQLQVDDTLESLSSGAITSFTSFDSTNMHSVCYSAVMFCFSLADPILHVRATQALCSVFTGQPKLMLLANSSGLLKNLFSVDQSFEVHMTLMKSLTKMMISEEARLESTALELSMTEAGERVKQHAPTESDSDFTPAGFVLQTYLPVFVDFLSHSNLDIRTSSLKLIGTLLRQGMLCPLDAISPLISLQGDEDYSIRILSMKILDEEVRKHPNFFDNRLLEGIEATFDRQWKMSGQANPYTEDGVSLFSALYTTSIVTDRRRREAFICGLLKKCLNFCVELNDGLNSNKVQWTTLKSAYEATLNLEKASFVSTTVALLPFELADEVHLLVHWIGRHVSITSALLINHMKTLFDRIGAKPRVEGGMQAPPEGRKVSKSAGKAKVAALDDGLLFDPQHLLNARLSEEELGSISSKLLLGAIAWRCNECLLRLKSHIKSLYSLSEEKCQTFSPDDKVSYEKVRANDLTEPFTPWSKEVSPLFPSAEGAALDSTSITPLLRFLTADFNRFLAAIESDSDDFVVTSNKKRGKGLKRTESGASVKKLKKADSDASLKSKKPTKAIKKPKKKRSLSKMNGSGSESVSDSEASEHSDSD